MRQAKILFKNIDAGVLTQHDDGSYTFQYNESWLNDTNNPGISLTLPKKKEEYRSKYFFPFFYNMLPEGSNKDVVCRYNRLDKNDYFGLLVTTAKNDTIGAIRVIKIG